MIEDALVTPDRLKMIHELRDYSGMGILSSKKALIKCDWNLDIAKIYIIENEHNVKSMK
jgi:translation elongation factor EF-Ts